MVGCDSSTDTEGEEDAAEDDEVMGADAAAAGWAGALVEGPGVGLPKRCPLPPKGLYFCFGCTNF